MCVSPQDYLQSQHKTVQDMLRECCTKLDSGEYTCAGKPNRCTVFAGICKMTFHTATDQKYLF